MGNSSLLARIAGVIDADEDFFRDEKATGTITCATVLEETKATGTITMNGPTGEVHASGTATLVSVLVGETITVNGLIYTAVSGAKANDTEFDISGTDNAAATDLADSIDDDTRVGTLDDVTATASTNVVTIVSTVGGTGGNAITLADDTAAITLSGATLAGGINGDTVTVNGLVYTATVGARADDTEFSVDTSDTARATDLAAAISGDTRTPVTVPLIDVTATSSVAVVTLVPATVLNASSANSIDIVESTSGVRMSVSGALMTGGVDADQVVINGLNYKAVAGARADDTEFSTDTSDNATATDLAAAVTADVRVGTTLDVVATASTNVVTAEETIGGTAGNAITLTSTDGTTLAVSGATFTGGTSPKHAVDFSVSGQRGRTPSYLRVLCHSVEAVTLKIAYDGAAFVNLGPIMVADAVNEFTVPVIDGDIINFQCASSITLRRFSVLAIYQVAS